MQRALGSLGATVLAAALTGCSGYGYDISECTPEQSAYIADSMSWIEKQSVQMDSEMESIYPASSVSSAEIFSGLKEARLECGVGKDEDLVPATSWRELLGRDHVVIDTSDEWVVDGLEMYEDTLWVADIDYSDLDNPEYVDFAADTNPVGDAYRYALSLSELGVLLMHEGAHLQLGDHTQAVKQAADTLATTGPLTPEDTAHLDQIYGHGYSALAIVDDINEQILAAQR